MVILICALAVTVWVVARGSRPMVVAQSRSVAPFTSVTLAGGNLVSVRVGAPWSVVVRARTDMLARVSTEVRAGTLVIAENPRHGATKGPMGVSVTLPALSSLAISDGGSGIVNVTGLRNQSLSVTLAGSGMVNASGTTTHLTVQLSGSGDLELGDLAARNARVTVNGSGRAMVTATGSLDALVSGDGMIQYAGNPAHLSTSVTGSGVIIPG
ncbi:MAG: head GIN domain-containing protein [Solirubrobacteraceae bacterium]